MNRIILIGNGFDLAHKLPTGYASFINWYWDEWKRKLLSCTQTTIKDELCNFSFSYNNTWLNYFNTRMLEYRSLRGYEFVERLKQDNSIIIKQCYFLSAICKSIETKHWVDIENEYYNCLKKILNKRDSERQREIKDLNAQLKYLQDKLIEYLAAIKVGEINHIKNIEKIIYSPIYHQDISVSNTQKLVEHVVNGLTCPDDQLRFKLTEYKKNYTDFLQLCDFRNEINNTSTSVVELNIHENLYPEEFFLPDSILMMNFNYTDTARLYLPTSKPDFEINHIHGKLNNRDSIIFGYGDELDAEYKTISNLNNNEFLSNFKSIKYLESDRYRKALQFMDAAPYQVFILGHSCGNSDRTLLNTLFEHKNCVSIKPYYFQKQNGTDNYLDIVQNISRNFTDMKLMRDRVVNKTFCEAFSRE